MKTISESDLKGLVESGRETPETEFKSAFKWSRTNTIDKLRLIRAVLAMNNNRSGGRVIIGIKEKPKYKVEGVDDDQKASFDDIEGINRTINKCSSTPIGMDIASGIYTKKNKKQVTLIVINVSEFDRVPAICLSKMSAKDENGNEKLILEERAIYVRTEKRGISSDKLSQYEINDLIELCVNKGVRHQNLSDWAHLTQMKKLLKLKLPTPSATPKPESFFNKTDVDITK